MTVGSIGDGFTVSRTVPLGSSRRRVRFLLALAHHSSIATLSILFLLPILFVALTSVMSEAQALSDSLWPRPFRWSNYLEVVRTAPLHRFGWNSLKVATLSTIGTLVSSIPVAYALSRLRWRGRQAVLFLVLTVFMLPPQVTVVPLYVIFAELGWVGSLQPLFLPSFFGDAFSIFLLCQCFRAIPDHIVDAARIEGAGHLQVLLRVVVPVGMPAIAAVALFHWVFVWNDLYRPLLYLAENRDAWTLPLALSEFRGRHEVQWNLTLAASLLLMLPMVVAFLGAQRVLLKGMTISGAVK